MILREDICALRIIQLKFIEKMCVQQQRVFQNDEKITIYHNSQGFFITGVEVREEVVRRNESSI